MNPSDRAGLTSIIVPCFNQREFTRHCLQALFQHTRPAWELIVVDNGSTDGTAIYLEGAQDTTAVPVTVVTNARNRGFPVAVNQGLEVARGEFLVILNNDAVVTDGWLDQLIALTRAGTTFAKAEGGGLKAADGTRTEEKRGVAPTGGGTETTERKTEDDERVLTILDYVEQTAATAGGSEKVTEPAQVDRTTRGIGLAGPMSNYAAPPQLVEGVPYRDLEGMHVFAQRWRDEHRGQWFTVPKLSGFCVLMKRAVYDAIGGLDEQFGLGLFDDDDLAERARRAGFELAVAHDLFVHHFGSRTFAGNGIDAEGLLEENAKRFADKWGQGAARGQRIALQPWSSEPGALAGPANGFLRKAAKEDAGPRNRYRDSTSPTGSPTSER